jgi:para-nitrobenzyl esterase
LNVLTPGLQGKRPVMIYIHGGGFAIGSGALTLVADRFVAEQDVVLVGVNHRLNVFGYTYLGAIDPKYADSGNVGQLDLIAALQWVRDNIAHFGGDPSNVTIFGESGGGGKVSTLMAMPGAKGLFRRAIVESGSHLAVRTKEAATENTNYMLSALGLTASQVDQLQSVPADKLLAAMPPGPMGLDRWWTGIPCHIKHGRQPRRRKLPAYRSSWGTAKTNRRCLQTWAIQPRFRSTGRRSKSERSRQAFQKIRRVP